MVGVIKQIEYSLQEFEKCRQAILNKSEEEITVEEIKLLYKMSGYYKKVYKDLLTYKNNILN